MRLKFFGLQIPQIQSPCMNEMLRIIENISSEDDYPTQLQILLSIIIDPSGKNTSRPETIALLDTLDSLVSSDSDPIYKFYAVLVARDMFARRYTQFISCLSSSKLLQSMLYLAKTTDPDKRVEDKGRGIFRDLADMGNDYITLILECLVKWSERYPLTGQNSPTKFRMAYLELLKLGVVLPKQFRFFQGDSSKAANTDEKEKEREKEKEKEKEKEREKRFSQSSMSGLSSNENLTPRGLETSVKNSVTKIQGFLTFLDECDDADKLKMEIDKYHRLFQLQFNKNDGNLARIFDQHLLDEESTNLFLGLQEFYIKENEAYSQCLADSVDLKGYLDMVAISSEQIKDKILSRINPNSKISGESPIATALEKLSNMKYDGREERGSFERRTTDVVNDSLGPKVTRNSFGRIEPALSKESNIEEVSISYRKQNPHAMSYDPPSTYQINVNEDNSNRASNTYTTYVPNRNVGAVINNRETQQTTGTSGYFNDRQLDSEVERGTMLIRELLSQVTTNVGFGSVKKELERERSLSNRSRNPNRTKKSRSPQPRSRHRRLEEESNFNSRDVSKVDAFEMNQASKVSKDDYSGRYIDHINYDLSDMSLGQGWRKFRKSHFKDKGILFENEHLQVGYKSQAVYEDLQEFKVFIKIGLYVGNKCNEQISRLDVDYEGDESSIMYCAPKKIDDAIAVGLQAKQDLALIPLHFPFSPISCVLKYSLRRQEHTIVFYLPSSIAKLSSLQPLTPSKFKDLYSKHERNQSRTQTFKLSKECPPSVLQKSFDNSVLLSDYGQFIAQKSYAQLVLGLYFLVMDSYEYLVKVIVRPDLSVVLQGVAVDPSKESMLYGDTALQTVQMLLQGEAEQ